MAQNYLSSELQLGNFESRIDAITLISPTDTPFLTKLGRGKIENTTHNWQTESLQAAANNEVVEGASVTYAATDFSARATVLNYTQISRKKVSVTYTQDSIRKPQLGSGDKSEYNHQKYLKTKELSRDIEFSLVSNNDRVQPLPESSQAGRSRAAQFWITSNVVDAATYQPATLSQGMFDQNLAKCWSQGGNPKAIFSGVYNKRLMAGWVGTPIRNISEQGTKIVNAVDQYQGVTGQTTEVFLERNLTSVMLLLDMDYWKMGWLRPYFHEMTGPTGGKTEGYVESEWMLISLAQNASGKITGLATEAI